jgi:biopolymer transport protein ExbD
MLRSRRGSRRNVDTAELNITAFMNLMVILVPFLLITAVFSRLAILELNLPGSSTEPANPQELVFQLEVIVREGRIEVGDRNIGALGIYPNTPQGYDYEALSAKLSAIKKSYPDKTDAAILLESNIDAAILLESNIAYDTLVQVMDRVRIEERVEDQRIRRFDLFPDISIGDAPVVDGA